MRSTHQRGAFAPGAAASDPTNDNAPVARRVEGLKGDQGHRESTEDSRTTVVLRQRVHERVLQAMAPITATSSEKRDALLAIRDAHAGNAGAAQEQRLLAALEKFPVSSLEASRLLDCYHPPARILNLRKRGHEILTSRVRQLTESGKAHCIGVYHLVRGQQGGAA